MALKTACQSTAAANFATREAPAMVSISPILSFATTKPISDNGRPSTVTTTPASRLISTGFSLDLRHIVHCAGVGKIREDTAQAENLVRASERAGVGHLVSVSVVEADRIPVKTAVDQAMFAYFASQRAKEIAVAQSGVPWTNLCATQFHDGFVLFMVRGMSKLPLVPVPAGFRFQPVDTDEVADHLVRLALGAPAPRRTSAGPGSTTPSTSRAATSRRSERNGRSFASACRVRPRRRCGPART